MLTVACVETRNYLGRGAEYVRKLRAMVARNMEQPFRFACLTDEPKRHALPREEIHELLCVDKLGQLLTGWWAKLYLFSPGRFEGRVLYLDLDSVIVGSLDELAAHKGAVNLRDWGWDRDVSAGGMLCWDAGEHLDAWEGAPLGPKRYANDQEYLNDLAARGGDPWPVMQKGLCVSYRYHCKSVPPAGARLVAFHGVPKPHELSIPWVEEAWRE